MALGTIVLYYSIMRIISVILELFLYLIVGRFKAFNLSLYDFFDSSGINFVALFCTHSSLSTSVFFTQPTLGSPTLRQPHH